VTVSSTRERHSVRDQAPALIYFFLVEHEDSAHESLYQHTAIALAEGLESLNVRFVSNVDYWRARPEAAPLFCSDPAVDPYNCSVVVFTSDWLEKGLQIPSRLFAGPTRPISVYLDCEDGNRLRSLQPGFPKFDIVLRAHYTAAMPYPPNFRPWAFGLSNRIIEASTRPDPVEKPVPRIVVSYRHRRFPHSVRMHAEHSFLEKLPSALAVYRYTDDFTLVTSDPVTDHLWRITGRRHSDRYYSELRESAACACFGGYFVPAWPRDERHVLSRLMKRAMTPLRIRSRQITQFDSWRLWESFAAGCATLHLDLAKYGAVLPVMPENWKDYIGLDLDDVDADIDRMFGDPDLLQRIGLSGQAWSINTYGPRPTAERFLALTGLATKRH
jgi:hypothetical protein